MKWPIAIVGVVLAVWGLLAFDYAHPGKFVSNAPSPADRSDAERLAERIREAEARSQDVRGVYMTADVANDRGAAATKLRNDILALLDATELNAVVIDVKETRGGTILTERLGRLISELHGRRVWVIARIAVFKDSSQEQIRPEWYLKRKVAGSEGPAEPPLWRDNRGGSWLDPASPEVWAYQLAVAKAAADAGFDEIQFDYIRFPSDGNLAEIVYPVYQPGQPKWGILRAFFAYLDKGLRRHRPDLILSADLFGYVALQAEDLGIGQRLADIGENFDYVSLMVYPSHYYAGFQVAPDRDRNLPALSYPYRAAATSTVAASHPYEVVHRSLLIASGLLAGPVATTSAQERMTATTTLPLGTPAPLGKVAKLRPWLQDFDLAVDTARGIRYDAAKVRAQIQAAEDAGSSGWLLWSPDNVYTREALRPK